MITIKKTTKRKLGFQIGKDNAIVYWDTYGLVHFMHKSIKLTHKKVMHHRL
jgi:hypothetical protein